MALADAILVCLTEKPMTGYDLARTFDSSIGFFWMASHQQIYRELGRLKDRRLVQVQEIAQTGKPNRLVYSITEEGRSALRSWSTLASPPPTIRDDLLIRLYALQDIDVSALREQVALRLEHHQNRLARYQKIRERHFSAPHLDRRETGRLLALDLGLLYETGWVQWCEEALSKLGLLRDTNIVSLQKRKDTQL